MNHQFGNDECRQCHKESSVRFDIMEERDLYVSTDGVTCKHR